MTHIWQGLRSGRWLTPARARAYSLILLGFTAIAVIGWIAVSDGLVDRNGKPVDMPLGAAQVFMSCWIRLYGMVCMEVFGHLRFALDDPEPMFEAELRALSAVLAIADEYRPPPA